MGRYVGPARIVFSGDPNVALRYVSAGRKLLAGVQNSKALGGIDRHSRTIPLPDGAVIEAIDDGPDLIIHIDVSGVEGPSERPLELFMESGYLDLRPIYPVGSGEKAAAKLYYGVPQLDLLNSPPSWLDWLYLSFHADSQLRLTGDATRDYAAGMDSLSVSSTWHPDDALLPESERRPNPDGTASKRYWIYPSWDGYHPINRSGKLRLLLQAAQGRDEARDPQCAHGSLRGLDAFSDSLGLYTYSGGTGEYAILRVNVSSGMVSLSAVPLRYLDDLQFAIKDLRPQIGGNADPVLEAWWLSTSFKTDDSPAVTVANLGEVIGVSYAYGWKFNRKGDRISIITSERVYSEGTDRILYYTGRYYEISISESGERTAENKYGLSAELSLMEEEKNYTPRTSGDLLWFPSVDDGESKLKCFYWEDYPGQYLNGPTLPCDGAPVYCWFDGDDELQIIRFFTELAEPIDEQNDVLIGCGEFHYETFGLYSSEQRVNAGFYMTGTIEKLYGDQSGSWAHQETLGIETHAGAHSCYANFAYLDCNGTFYPQPEPDCGTEGPPYIGWSYHHMLGKGWYRIDQYTEVSSSKTLLIIPFSCAEGVYLGSLDNKTQAHIDKIYEFNVITSVIGLPVLHSQQSASLISNNYSSTYQNLIVKALGQHNKRSMIDKTIESGETATLGWDAGWTAYGKEDDFPSDFNNLLDPVLYGPYAYPWHRPIAILESDSGLMNHEQADPTGSVLVFASTDENLPYTEWFSTFVGSA